MRAGWAAPTRESLALVDAEIGRIEDTLRPEGSSNRRTSIVTSDHGFSTHTGGLQPAALVAPLCESWPTVRRTSWSPKAPSICGQREPARVGRHRRRAAAAAGGRRHLHAPRRRADSEGVVPGTLSFEVARWNHPRSGEILVSANWSREKANDGGYKGRTTQGGVAGHGTSSPYDIHNTLMAAGPDFRARTASDMPTGNVDVAPTLLHLLGLSRRPRCPAG